MGKRRVTTVRNRSVKQEQNLAGMLKGAGTVTGSGSNPFRKGDIRSDAFLIEAKYTDKDFYILRLNTWQKIVRGAVADGLRIPAMLVDLKYETPEQKTLVIVDANLIDAKLVKAYPANFAINTTNSSCKITDDFLPKYVTFFNLKGRVVAGLFIGELKHMQTFLNDF